MPTLISAIETKVRHRLIEPVPRFWSSSELVEIIVDGIRDLWRDIADLKQEHFLRICSDVTLFANATTLSGLPTDVHKIYLIEPLDPDTNIGLRFQPADRNQRAFQSARGSSTVEPSNATIYYAISQAGGPVGAPIIHVAPSLNTDTALSFSYVPTLGAFEASSVVPIPGEADNALVAWTVAYARAKERPDRAPDPTWLSIYATDKAHLLQSLGLRQYQEPSYVDALYEEYWS